MLEYAATLDPKCKPTAVVKKGRAPGTSKPGEKVASWRDMPVEKRLEHALIKVCVFGCGYVRPQCVRGRHGVRESLGARALMVPGGTLLNSCLGFRAEMGIIRV